MNPKVHSSDDLRDLAEHLGLPLDQVERELLLLNIAGHLVERFPTNLCFKGGFVLRHGYRNDRFSYDIDATRVDPPRHKLDADEVAKAIRDAARPLFQVRRLTPGTDSARSLDFDSVAYKGPIGTGTVSVEVSYREDVILDSVTLSIGPPYFEPFTIPTLAPTEMVAEKLRTLAQRQRPTDLFDCSQLLAGLAGTIADAEVAALVPRKFAEGLVKPGNHMARIEENIRRMEPTYDAAIRVVAPRAPPYHDVAERVLERLRRLFP